MSTVASAPVVVGSAHVRPRPDGSFSLQVRGRGPALVIVGSARRIGTRWLGGPRPRLVRLGLRRAELTPGRTATVAFRLSEDHLALLRRMQTVRATVSVTTPAGACRRRIYLHAPARQRRRHDDVHG
jgi:hypothetical protein